MDTSNKEGNNSNAKMSDNAGQVSRRKGFLLGHGIALAGAVCLMLGPFLPWVERRGATATGMQLTGGEAGLLAVLGGLVLIVSAMCLSRQKHLANWLYLIGSLLAVGGAGFYVHMAYYRYAPNVLLWVFLPIVGAVATFIGFILASMDKTRSRKVTS